MTGTIIAKNLDALDEIADSLTNNPPISKIPNNKKNKR